jgi:ABC-type polysaccharide/polyol phosphate export permease
MLPQPDYSGAIDDIVSGLRMREIWGRIGWAEAKRRYRRTVIGPFWSSLSMAIFVVALSIVWSRLWKIEPKEYLPFLTSGMMAWILFSSCITEGCAVFVAAENLIKQLRIPYTMLVCILIWRNIIVFFHNLAVYVLVALYAHVALTWATLLAIPALALLCLNTMWIVLLLGMFCARYRDIQQVIVSFLQVALFVTPIMWSPSQLTGRAAYIADYNMLYHYIEILREPLLGRAPTLWSWFMVSMATIIGWGVTLFLYSRFRRRVAYWV